MKSYDELTNDLLARRDNYVTERKKKRKTIIGAVSVAGCLCIAALIGVGVWAAGTPNSAQSAENINGAIAAGAEDSTSDTLCGTYWVEDGSTGANQSCTSEAYALDDGSNGTDNMSASSSASCDVSVDEPAVPGKTDDAGDAIGMIFFEDEWYVQFATGSAAEAYTIDKCIGGADEFEGSYKTCLIDEAAKVFTVKEDSNVLVVKLGNGGIVALRKN